MKITTLEEHGKVVYKEDYGNLEPQCYREFNPSLPIFTIEEDELNILNSKSKSFEKSNLIHQFKAAFDIDFSLFLESKYNKYRDLGQVLSDLMQDRIIESADKELSVLLKNYSRYYYKYKTSKLSPCASEILLSDKWLDVLLYHALISSKRNRNAKYPDFALLTSFLNLLGTYYYALKKYEIGNFDVKIEERLTTLRPYSDLYKSLYGRPIGFNGGFLDKLLASLHVSKYKNRCVHYNLIALINQLASSTTNDMCCFLITESKKTHTQNVFSLSDYAHNERFIITLNDLEIAYLRDPTSEVFAEVSKSLSKIYSEHEEYNRNKFEKEIESDYEEYCSNYETKDWSNYKIYYKKEIRKRASEKNDTDPEECYYQMLFPYYASNDMVSISDIIADLFTILKENKSKDQYSLYKGIICLNYIKQQIKNEELGLVDEASNAVKKAIRYIMPIYDGRHVNKDYKKSIKTIIDEFMNLEDTRDNITDIIPNTFDGGFNLKLVYNFIGLLKFYNIVKDKGDLTIDSVIREYAKEHGLTADGTSHRKLYINEWESSDILSGNYQTAVKALVEEYQKK